MGLMDKLRSMAAVVTGGGATVQVEAVDPCQDGPFTVNVQAEVGGSDLKIDKVYLKLMGVETVTLEVEMPAASESAATPEEAAPESKSKMGKNLSKSKMAPPEAEAESAEAEKPTTTMKEISKTEQTYLQEFELAGAQTLSADQTYTWSSEVQLPADAKPRYQGVHATHEWKILAGLSAFGNDPDSGWQVLDF